MATAGALTTARAGERIDAVMAEETSAVGQGSAGKTAAIFAVGPSGVGIFILTRSFASEFAPATLAARVGSTAGHSVVTVAVSPVVMASAEMADARVMGIMATAETTNNQG